MPLGKDKLDSYMQEHKMFRTEGAMYDAIEQIQANLSIVTELEKTDRNQIEKIQLYIEDIEERLDKFIEVPMWKLAVRKMLIYFSK